MESIVNNRAITTVTDDPDNCSALTPNHILLQRATQLPPGVFVKKKDLFSRTEKGKGVVPCGPLLEEVDTRVCAYSSDKTKMGQIKKEISRLVTWYFWQGIM